jgi:hypothetical protein
MIQQLLDINRSQSKDIMKLLAFHGVNQVIIMQLLNEINVMKNLPSHMQLSYESVRRTGLDLIVHASDREAFDTFVSFVDEKIKAAETQQSSID